MLTVEQSGDATIIPRAGVNATAGKGRPFLVRSRFDAQNLVDPVGRVSNNRMPTHRIAICEEIVKK